ISFRLQQDRCRTRAEPTASLIGLPASGAFVSSPATALTLVGTVRCAVRTSSDVPTSVRDCVAPANAGEHFPESLEHAVHRRFYGFKIVLVNEGIEDLSLGVRMFAIRFDVDGEILIMLGTGEAVVFF